VACEFFDFLLATFPLIGTVPWVGGCWYLLGGRGDRGFTLTATAVQLCIYAIDICNYCFSFPVSIFLCVLCWAWIGEGSFGAHMEGLEAVRRQEATAVLLLLFFLLPFPAAPRDCSYFLAWSQW
jgi:hypothetical protein